MWQLNFIRLKRTPWRTWSQWRQNVCRRFAFNFFKFKPFFVQIISLVLEYFWEKLFVPLDVWLHVWSWSTFQIENRRNLVALTVSGLAVISFKFLGLCFRLWFKTSSVSNSAESIVLLPFKKSAECRDLSFEICSTRRRQVRRGHAELILWGL